MASQRITMQQWDNQGHKGKFFFGSSSWVEYVEDHYVLTTTTPHGVDRQNFWSLKTLGIYIGKRPNELSGEVLS